jgi:EmrB/QacA subfamily drug resistance transporter
LVAIISASAITYIDESVVNIALPVIAKDQASSITVVQWVMNAYILCLAAFLLVGGAAGDRFGRRRVFVIGITIFAIASVWSCISASLAQLVLARVVQGIGAALVIPCSLAIIGASFPEAEQGKVIGTWAGFSAIAAGVGPLLGGWLVDHVTWRAIFLITPLLAAFAIWIAWRHLPESHDPEAPAGIDWMGSLLAFAGLGAIAFGLIALPNEGLQDIPTIGGLAVGVLLLIGFVWHEGRTRFPMMPLDLFRSRTFTGINVMTLLLYGALGGVFFLLPFELIQVHGYSASVAGVAFLPFTIMIGALSRWFGGVLGQFGARLQLIIAPMIAAIGFALLAWSGPTTPYVIAFLLPISIVGLGMAVHVVPLTTTVINAVPGQQTGVASGVNNAVASLADLLAIVIFGAVALSGLTSGLGEDRAIAEAVVKESMARGIRLAMLLAATLALAATVCAVLTVRRREDRRLSAVP